MAFFLGDESLSGTKYCEVFRLRCRISFFPLIHRNYSVSQGMTKYTRNIKVVRQATRLGPLGAGGTSRPYLHIRFFCEPSKGHWITQTGSSFPKLRNNYPEWPTLDSPNGSGSPITVRVHYQIHIFREGTFCGDGENRTPVQTIIINRQ